MGGKGEKRDAVKHAHFVLFYFILFKKNKDRKKLMNIVARNPCQEI